MTDTKMGNALCKAANSGDVAKIRELLTAGAPIEATDVNRFTPVMLAAQGGHEEAFQTLVKAGANLNALGLSQTDLLERAAEGGNVDILRFVIGLGHPIEGHWQPRSKVVSRMGHITPLIMAAINGHVDAVRVLLEAGANRDAKFDGQTALKLVQEDIKHPFDDNDKQKIPQLKQIVALLTGSSAGKKSADDSAAQEVAKFAANARRPEYKRLQESLSKVFGAGRAWKPTPDHGIAAKGVVAFKLAGCKKQKTLEDLQEEARAAGCQLVLAEAWAPGDDAALVLFPTDDKFAVMAAVGTEGANYSVQNADVIAWLREVNEENPFQLISCGHDLVGGAFLKSIKNVKKLAEKMAELCPSCLDDGAETPEELAAVLKKRKSFLLRWD